ASPALVPSSSHKTAVTVQIFHNGVRQGSRWETEQKALLVVNHPFVDGTFIYCIRLEIFASPYGRKQILAGNAKRTRGGWGQVKEVVVSADVTNADLREVPETLRA